MTRLSYKDREKRRREHFILLEARRLIQDGGFADLNMDHLAEAVGISKPTIYQHFKSKEDLIARVLVDYLRALEHHLVSAGGGSPLERLKAVLRIVLVQRYLADQSLAEPDADSVFTLLHTHPDVIAAKKKVMARLNQVIEEGKASGEIRANIPTTMVGCLLVRMFGLLSTVRAVELSDSGAPISRETMQGHIDTVIDLFAHSVAQDKVYS